MSPIMPVQVEPVEALLLTVHMGAWLMVVMVVVLLATVTSTSSGKKRPRKYTQRKPKEDPAAPPCPDCPYGYGRKKRSGDKYKATCSTCYADKKNGRTRRQSSSASEEDGAAESSQQQNTGTSASEPTQRRLSGASGRKQQIRNLISAPYEMPSWSVENPRPPLACVRLATFCGALGSSA